MMGKSLEEKLAALHSMLADPDTETDLELLRKAIKSSSNILVSKAAQVVGDRKLEPLAQNLEEAFSRLMANPLKNDKTCKGKTAIVEAMNQIGFENEQLFLKGIRYVQLEPSFGGPLDTAAKLRGLCGMALVRIGYPYVIAELAGLLADTESDTRILAARAIGHLGSLESMGLLRLRVLCGESNPDVLEACFKSMLEISSELSVPFVEKYLVAQQVEIVEAAALALGDSRLPVAFNILSGAYRETDDSEKSRAILLAIALLREETAVEFLISLLSDNSIKVASEAIAALGVYRHDEKMRLRVEEVVKKQKSAELDEAMKAAFQ